MKILLLLLFTTVCASAQMKLIRVTYLTPEASELDIDEALGIGSPVLGGEIILDGGDPVIIEPDSLAIESPEIYTYQVDSLTVDMLVPEDFDISTISGTIIEPDSANILHEFLGHNRTRRIVDNLGTIKEPLIINLID